MPGRPAETTQQDGDRKLPIPARRIRSPLSVCLLLTASLWVVHPVLRQFDSALPTRSKHLHTPPLFGAWTIWWNADRAASGFSEYWQAPIFHPQKNTFAYSEPQPATVVVAPFVWLFETPAVAYNLYLVASLFLNGCFTWVILRRQRIPHWCALFGALMMVWLPIGMCELAVIQVLPVWPMLWTWDAIRRHGHSPTVSSGFETALAFTVSFYTCIHHTLFLSVILVPTVWPLLARIRTRRFWLASALCATLAGILAGIVFVPMRQAISERSFRRPIDLVARLSAKPEDLLTAPDDAKIRLLSAKGRGCSPGWIKLSLAAIGLGAGLWRQKRRRWTVFLVLSAVTAGLFALGPNLWIGSFQPWTVLSAIVPGVNQVRNVFRFSYLMQMAVILLAAGALAEIRLRTRRCGRSRILLTSVLGVLALFETLPPRPNLVGLPIPDHHRTWTTFVAENTPPGRAIACFPFSPQIFA